MDSDNDSYNSENEFYYPDEQNVLQENKNKFKMAAVKIQFKNCLQSTLRIRKKKIASGRTQDLWHSFSQYVLPGLQITYFFMITMFLVFPTFVAESQNSNRHT